MILNKTSIGLYFNKYPTNNYTRPYFGISRNDLSGDTLELSGYSCGTTIDTMELPPIQYENPLDKYRANIPYNGNFELDNGVFMQSDSSHGSHYPWKMHLYATTTQEHQQILNAVGPYLDDIGVIWKTAKDEKALNSLNSYNQRGKAFTIYPRTKRDFERIARDVDYIIRANNLTTKQSRIIGDNSLGKTGRIFYRYDLSSGIYKDSLFYTSESYNEHYHEYNRGANNYLAYDMTSKEDPWRKYDPASGKRIFVDNIDGVPVQEIIAYDVHNREVTLTPNAIYALDDAKNIVIAGKYNLDLSHPDFERLFKKMKDGEYIVIGRGEDCHYVICEDDTDVSRYHVKIYKKGHEFFIQDLSKNGTGVITNNVVLK